MFGIVLAIGIVVDDAIIVVEAVQRYIDEEHMPAREATIHAMKDITAPVIAVALILASVFRSGCLYPRDRRPLIPAVCHHHCSFYFNLCFYRIISNTCCVFPVIKTTSF
jgi:hypothetical protein